MKSFLRLLLLTVGLCAVVAPVRAEDIAAAQKRLQERAPAVDSIKQRGLVGENNQGFLEARGAVGGADATVVSDENRDRAIAYTELAKRSGSTPDNVGRVRAKRIAELSTSGIWLQDESGKWYKK